MATVTLNSFCFAGQKAAWAKRITGFDPSLGSGGYSWKGEWIPRPCTAVEPGDLVVAAFATNDFVAYLVGIDGIPTQVAQVVKFSAAGKSWAQRLADSPRVREALQGMATSNGMQHIADNVIKPAVEAKSNASKLAKAVAGEKAIQVVIDEADVDPVLDLCDVCNAHLDPATGKCSKPHGVPEWAKKPEVVKPVWPPVFPKQVAKPHKELSRIWALSLAKRHVWMSGPAGCGKSYAAAQLAELWDLPFYCFVMFPDITVNQLLGGFRLVNGTQEYLESPIIASMRTGGVLFVDEVDNGDPSTLVALNGLLNDRAVTIPATGEHVKALDSWRVVVAANTWGSGPNAAYCGRARLDAATLDRFAGSMVYVDYDLDLERSLYDGQVCDMVQAVRKACAKKRIQRVVSMRITAALSDLKAIGAPDTFLVEQFTQSWSTEEKQQLLPFLAPKPKYSY